ncbi:hypothetical protein [Dokdonia sinensis]|uniref:hypothetical protein n=1 Tax=Dokdonia sinensis TaxID=2479847 RepID=UPI00191C5F14|nr:hypothetical protein [Dokdonia sinensis]
MKKRLFLIFLMCIAVSCAQSNDESTTNDGTTGTTPSITGVVVDGVANAYTFNVTVQSPDTGCDQYADWWEVLSLTGDLLYRRILAHSHVDEQPFTRSGGPVEIDANQTVLVRLHMNTTGYSVNGFRGSAVGGFTGYTFPDGFATALENSAPQPAGCAF